MTSPLNEQIQAEYLADASDCIQDAILTLTKLHRMGLNGIQMENTLKLLSKATSDLDLIRMQARTNQNNSASLATFLSGTVFQCQAILTN
jgi:hypothetical protein